MFISFTLNKQFVEEVNDDTYKVTLSFENVDELTQQVDAARAKKEVSVGPLSYTILGKPPTVTVGPAPKKH